MNLCWNSDSNLGNPFQDSIIMISYMRKTNIIKKKFSFPDWLFIPVVAIVVGLVSYLILYDKYGLFFSHVYWIYSTGRDPLQHQLGWEFFRLEPWRFPLGTIKSYGYPFGTTVTFMDSIPLFAFFFKVLSPWLSKNFQYFGLWELTSITCQMVAGMLIIREFTSSKILKILGASLLVLSPAMMYRAFFHSSLSAHWILLLAILFVILEYRSKMKAWLWVVLFSAAMLVHLYFIPMIIPIWGISLVFKYQRERRMRLILLEILKIASLIIVIGFCTGIFGLNMSYLSEDGMGQYSWNLNGLINPFDTSSFLKELPYIKTQQEGYSYLGLGMILLLIISVILFLIKDPAKKNYRFYLPWVAVSILFMLFALSNLAAVNGYVLWNIQIPDRILNVLNMFRASGRFIWPVYYFIIIFAIIVIIRNMRVAVVTVLFLIALFIQFQDLSPLYKSKRITDFKEYGSSLKNEFWQAAGTTNHHIVIIPTEYYEHLVIYGVRHDMTISSGYFGRADMNSMENLSLKIWDDLLERKSDPLTLYILSEEKYLVEARETLGKDMYICQIDQYEILFSKENPVTKTSLKLNSLCSVP